MTKRTSAKYKIDRRMGENIWGRPKSPVNRREYGPGQHGQRRKGKMSDFGLQLRAKQKLKGYYGDLTEKQFKRIYGKRRPGGQKPHDRYALQYKPWNDYPGPWRQLIEDLNGPVYRKFVRDVVGHDKFLLHYHWHYTPAGCSVSPHTDAPWKYGSHIFYLNTEDDWDEAWGGNTVVLDDGGRFKVRSAPKFEDFDRARTHFESVSLEANASEEARKHSKDLLDVLKQQARRTSPRAPLGEK